MMMMGDSVGGGAGQGSGFFLDQGFLGSGFFGISAFGTHLGFFFFLHAGLA